MVQWTRACLAELSRSDVLPDAGGRWLRRLHSKALHMRVSIEIKVADRGFANDRRVLRREHARVAPVPVEAARLTRGRRATHFEQQRGRLQGLLDHDLLCLKRLDIEA